MQPEAQKLLGRIRYIVDNHFEGKQRLLAEKSGIGPSTFGNYYNAKSVPTYSMLVSIYQASKDYINPIWFWVGLGDPDAMSEEELNQALERGVLESMAKEDLEELKALRKEKDFLRYKVDSLEKYIRDHIESK